MTEYKTQNKDHKLIPKSNGLYDVSYVAGDITPTEGLDSLKNAIIIKIMTAYQELYHTSNPTYQNFGNRAWSLIKANRTSTTAYKIEQYTLEALKEIRRIRTVDELKVTEDKTCDGYVLEYTVTSINDEQVTDKIFLTNYKDGLNTFMELKILYQETTTEEEHGYNISIRLTDELNKPVTGEICYIYINNIYYRVTPQTNWNGETIIYYPRLLKEDDTVTAVFHGDNYYNTVKSTYTYKTGV